MPTASTTSTHRTRHVTKKGRSGPFVKYVGGAAKRTIRQHEWRALGVELKGPKAIHEWSAANGFLIESSQFTDAQLDYLLIDDVQHGTNTPSFIEVDTDNDEAVPVAR
ncbi:hypothetical protein [Mycobacterium kiyosense]|uniref:Uncharacterized protein n=1 Tax=Mycobacterium kiyosense TaxID=2871094 RepID=A0A9P3Q862_9MYCO|nr:hypothetical protein [Mycobacterium kiyosense]GLB83488.1 hypothetical protein SRL2020028_27440 [Mycobacterium kiyosense]GLB94305.1 hypothetical protein SRL2020226_10810 [Mycobacterium kiyosense]GLD32638.1 hypothetical protein Mkiyose1413_45210 [Mycobacterium kiyosense]GLD37213.1 hypothetical protein Mkiyose1595_34330 [Mycobacterium kiyosense]